MNKTFSISLILILMFSISIFGVTKTLKSGGSAPGLDWNNGGSWIPSGVPTASDTVILDASSNNLLIDADAVCGTFMVQSGYTGNVNFTGASTLTVSGDWINDGAPTFGTGSVFIGGNFTNTNPSLDVTATDFTFNGTSGQTISSASTPADALSTFGNLTIDNPGTVTLLTDIGVETSFTIAQGTLDLNGNNLYVNGVLYTGPLPVELVSFSARISDSGVILNWSTATEVNNYGFEIQRSVQTGKWKVLGFVEGHGNSNSQKNYSFTDASVSASGVYYYRLKQVDNDGAHSFSNQLEINFEAPNSLELNQNYPNPFNPSTTISFNLPNSGIVTLKVYNLIGEEVKTLLDGYMEAGIHTFNFRAEGFPSGMYLYRLSTNGFTETKKMLFMK